MEELRKKGGERERTELLTQINTDDNITVWRFSGLVKGTELLTS